MIMRQTDNNKRKDRPMPTKKNEKKNAYVICCEPRVVLFGYATEAEIKKPNPTIERVRMLVYWSADTKGVHGAASIGPQKGSRVTPAAPSQTIRTKVEAAILCTPEAVAAWESGPWSS